MQGETPCHYHEWASSGDLGELVTGKSEWNLVPRSIGVDFVARRRFHESIGARFVGVPVPFDRGRGLDASPRRGISTAGFAPCLEYTLGASKSSTLEHRLERRPLVSLTRVLVAG